MLSKPLRIRSSWRRTRRERCSWSIGAKRLRLHFCRRRSHCRTVWAPHLPPVGRVGCPRGRVRGLFANKKSFLFAERPLGGVWKKIWHMGGRCPAPRLPPVDLAEGTHFLKFSKSALFFEFNFFNLFFKKILLFLLVRLL
jgi:hypothetical protein